jgi:6-phosphofructo-2-kinase/fructose-2,6-biphosphatase 2
MTSKQVWTSTMQRTIQTAQHLPYTKLTWKSLDELDAGVCDGMTYKEIEVISIDFFKFSFLPLYRKLTLKTMPIVMRTNSITDIEVIARITLAFIPYFNPSSQGGESYRDVVIRLEPVIMELERQENILIIGHQVCWAFFFEQYLTNFAPGHFALFVSLLRDLIHVVLIRSSHRYAYFHDLSQADLPYIKIPLHTVIKLTPKAYGCDEERCVCSSILAVMTEYCGMIDIPFQSMQ